MNKETEQTRLIMNSDCIEDNMEIQYPTEEEMEAMYAEFLKSGSFTEVFDDDPF